MALIDHLLPACEQQTRHCRSVPCAPHAAVDAARVLEVGEVRGLRVLLGARALPGLTRGRSPVARGGLIDLGLRYGFGILWDAPDELVVGLIGQPWRLGGGEVVPFTDAEQFRAFARPGFVKVAADFRAEPQGAGSLLCTETRVAATDGEAARRFARYWRVISPFGGWLRRQMLAAAARRCRPH